MWATNAAGCALYTYGKKQKSVVKYLIIDIQNKLCITGRENMSNLEGDLKLVLRLVIWVF